MLWVAFTVPPSYRPKVRLFGWVTDGQMDRLMHWFKCEHNRNRNRRLSANISEATNEQTQREMRTSKHAADQLGWKWDGTNRTASSELARLHGYQLVIIHLSRTNYVRKLQIYIGNYVILVWLQSVLFVTFMTYKVLKTFSWFSFLQCMTWVGMGTTAHFPASNPPLGLESIAKWNRSNARTSSASSSTLECAKWFSKAPQTRGLRMRMRMRLNWIEQNRTEQNWTELNCSTSEALSASHVPTYFNLFHIRTW